MNDEVKLGVNIGKMLFLLTSTLDAWDALPDEIRSMPEVEQFFMKLMQLGAFATTHLNNT